MAKTVEPGTTYEYLERQPDSWRKQLFVKGTGRWVANVVITMLANKMTPREAAEDMEVPEEAVYDCLRYFDRNREIIRADQETEQAR